MGNYMFQSTSSEEDVVSAFLLPVCLTTRSFQSTSSEEDVVSPFAETIRHWLATFQSTSSEEDVVSNINLPTIFHQLGFNPRPPKRTLCLMSL